MHVQRLDAETVAREQQRLLTIIIERKRPHTDEALDARCAPGLVSAQDDLGIAV